MCREQERERERKKCQKKLRICVVMSSFELAIKRWWEKNLLRGVVQNLDSRCRLKLWIRLDNIYYKWSWSFLLLINNFRGWHRQNCKDRRPAQVEVEKKISNSMLWTLRMAMKKYLIAADSDVGNFHAKGRFHQWAKRRNSTQRECQVNSRFLCSKAEQIFQMKTLFDAFC